MKMRWPSRWLRGTPQGTVGWRNSVCQWHLAPSFSTGKEWGARWEAKQEDALGGWVRSRMLQVTSTHFATKDGETSALLRHRGCMPAV